MVGKTLFPSLTLLKSFGSEFDFMESNNAMIENHVYSAHQW